MRWSKAARITGCSLHELEALSACVIVPEAMMPVSQVLVMDEATANVDVETDALIQATVRKEFAGCTLIAIAHRLQTVIDADSVLVMDAGNAAEFGHPAELLSNKDGVLSGTCKPGVMCFFSSRDRLPDCCACKDFGGCSFTGPSCESATRPVLSGSGSCRHMPRAGLSREAAAVIG